MDYTKKKFSISVGSDNYRENWDRVFGKKESTPASFDANGSPVEAEARSVPTSYLELVDAYTTECEAHEKTQYRLRQLEEERDLLATKLDELEWEAKELQKRISDLIGKWEPS